MRTDLVQADPDLVYVAFGAPKQERVIAALRSTLPKAWWIGVGISLGFVAGKPRRAASRRERAGLEWLHRFAQEPRRLTRRYFFEDLPFTFRLLVHARRAKR
jgi:N-acetylglucosaminyldiphosphoundecaprenol N-acetyl-beta-D-mannosaminyltransferase